MFTLSQMMYLFEATLNLLANTLTPDIAQYHLEKNLTASCLRCWSTVLTKRETHVILYNYGGVQRQMHREQLPAITTLAGRATFLKFYQKMSG